MAHGLHLLTPGLHKRGFEPETNTTFVPSSDRDALVSAILEAPGHPRQQIAATSEGTWTRSRTFIWPPIGEHSANDDRLSSQGPGMRPAQPAEVRPRQRVTNSISEGAQHETRRSG